MNKIQVSFPNVYRDYEEANIFGMVQEEITHFQRLYNPPIELSQAHADFAETLLSVEKYREAVAKVTIKGFVDWFNFVKETNESLDYEYVKSENEGQSFLISISQDDADKWEILAEEFFNHATQNATPFAAIVENMFEMKEKIVDDMLQTSFSIRDFMIMDKEQYYKRLNDIYKICISL